MSCSMHTVVTVSTNLTVVACAAASSTTSRVAAVVQTSANVCTYEQGHSRTEHVFVAMTMSIRPFFSSSARTMVQRTRNSLWSPQRLKATSRCCSCQNSPQRRVIARSRGQPTLRTMNNAIRVFPFCYLHKNPANNAYEAASVDKHSRGTKTRGNWTNGIAALPTPKLLFLWVLAASLRRRLRIVFGHLIDLALMYISENIMT